MGWAESQIDVQGEDVHGVSLARQEALSVSGSVRFDGAGGAPPLTSVRVSLSPQGSPGGITISGATGVNVTADGGFVLKGVSPGRYRLTAILPTPRPDWTVRSSTLGGQDALDTFVDVRQTMADRAITFTDHVADLSGHARADATVIVFATNQAFWYPQSRRALSTGAAGDGTNVLRNIPAGEYYVAAADDVEQGQCFDPSFVQTLIPSATKVTIAEGEKKTFDIH